MISVDALGLLEFHRVATVEDRNLRGKHTEDVGMLRTIAEDEFIGVVPEGVGARVRDRLTRVVDDYLDATVVHVAHIGGKSLGKAVVAPRVALHFVLDSQEIALLA